jgi:hypothetical protein
MSLNDQLAKLWAAGQTLSEIERSTGISRRVLVDLGRHDCRWPVGSAADGRHLMCGMPQAPGRPYCECHCRAVRSESTSQGRWEI